MSGEREEWMLLAELNGSTPGCTGEFPDIPEDYWEQDRKRYTQEQIGDMPSWISTQKEHFDIKTVKDTFIDISTLNREQHLAYSIVFDHFIQENENAVLLIITGLAGSGKSYVINSIKNLLKERCKVCAFFGVAAFN